MLSLVQIAVAPIAGPVVSVLVAVGSTLPLAWRRVHPAGAALTMTAVWLIPTSEGFLLLGYVIAGLLFYSLGAHEPQLWRVVVVSSSGSPWAWSMTLLGPEPWPRRSARRWSSSGPSPPGGWSPTSAAQTALLRS